jgi:AcrR family transcriptional regulator
VLKRPYTSFQRLLKYAVPVSGNRTRTAAETKDVILAAARARFGTHGYDRTTIRAVAAAAGVDPALVMHYFGNKDALFGAAARVEGTFPDLTGVPADRLADVLVPKFIATWRPDGPFLALLRSAAGNPAAAAALTRTFREEVGPALAKAAVDRPEERAALVSAQLLGLAVARFILRIPPLVDMTDDELIRWLRPVLARYMAG